MTQTPTTRGLNISSKGTLAKMLATENIQICQDPSVKTANFDLANRVLTLPVYQTLESSTVDTLVGHEVGHALFTPASGWKEFIDKNGADNDAARGVASHFLNVIEDARIDRRIKGRYPGLTLDYNKGWAELHNKHDIFGTRGMSQQELAELPFIDRINLHTKAGIHANVNVPFNAAERVILDQVMTASSFDEVAEIASKLYQDFVKDIQFPPNQQKNQKNKNGKGQKNQGEGQGQGDGKSQGSSKGEGQNQGKGQGQSGNNESQTDRQTKDRDGQGQGQNQEDSKEDSKNESDSGAGNGKGQDKQEDNDDQNESGQGQNQEDSKEDSKNESDSKPQNDSGEGEDESNDQPQNESDQESDSGDDEAESKNDSGEGEEESEGVFADGGRNNCTERPDMVDVAPNNTGSNGRTPGSTMNYANNKLQSMTSNGDAPVMSTIPDIDLKAVTVTTEYMRKNYSKNALVLGRSVAYSHGVKPLQNGACGWYHTNWDSMFAQLRQEFNRTHGGSINMMVQEFNRYKAADEFRRTGTAATGVINTNKLSHYKYSEDIFRRVTTHKSGKNHGIVMIVDWSGSMDGNLYDTMIQLVILTEFCRKVGIPFDVYAFSDVSSIAVPHERAIPKPQQGNILCSPFAMVNLISSNDSRINQNLNRDIMLGIAEGYRSPFHETRDLGEQGKAQIGGRRCVVTGVASLGGTPLNSAILAAFQIVPKFKDQNKLQVVHTVILTDGDATDDISGYEYRKGTWVNRRNTAAYKNATLQHKKTNTYQTGDWTKENITPTLLRLLEGATGTNATCLFLGGQPSYYCRDDKERKQYAEDGFYACPNRGGYSNYFALPCNTLPNTVRAVKSKFQTFTHTGDAKSEKKLQEAFSDAAKASKASKNIFRALGRAMSVNNYDPSKRRRSVVV